VVGTLRGAGAAALRFQLHYNARNIGAATPHTLRDLYPGDDVVDQAREESKQLLQRHTPVYIYVPYSKVVLVYN
jgi:hypothetical protein